MSSLSSSQRSSSSSRKPGTHRRLRRASVKKSLKFDDIEDTGDKCDEACANVGFSFSTSQSPLPAEGDATVPGDFWISPPPPMASNDTETTVNRRSMRLRTKNQFAFSQIGDRNSPKLLVNTTSDQVLLRKNPDARLQNVFSDYGTSSECSALYFQPSHQSSCSSSFANTKACFDAIVQNKCSRKATDTCSQSMGYSSDLDEVMSNLSIDEASGRLLERRWESDEENEENDSNQREPYLSLDDLKISSLKASLKIHEDIRVLIPLQGYEISHPSKCIGRRSLNINRHSLSKVRYDLRKRPGCPQLENILSIETFDVNIEEDFLKAGMRIFQVSPIISIQPHGVKFLSLCPAIVQIPLNLDPSSGDEVHCLYSRSSVDDLAANYSSISWSSEMAGKCSMKDGKVNFETLQFGIFVLVIRPKCPYTSSKKDIRARVGGKLVVTEFPHVTVSFPKEVTNLDIIRATAKIYFDTEEPVTEFVAHRLSSTRGPCQTSDCLATPIIQLEPHGINFESEPVMITLPVPDYDRIVSMLGQKAKLSIWQSNTHSSEASQWEKLDVEFQISHMKSHGETITVVTFPVSHFSFFKGVWEAISECLYDAKIGMLYYFVSFAMKCQAYMQEYPDQIAATSSKSRKDEETEKDEEGDESKVAKPIAGGNRFGLEVIVFQADKQWPQMETYKYKVGQSHPKLIKPGKICVRLKSLYFEPDVQAGEEEEMVKEESDFRGRDFEKQFICKFKPDVNIESGAFGKVLVTHHVSPRQKAETIFEFNIQKHGNEANLEGPVTRKMVDEEEEEWSMVALTELANCLFVTEDENWRTFALEIGMTKQEIVNSRLKYDANPFQKIVNHYRQRGGTAQELVDALYRCYRTLKVSRVPSGQVSNHTRSSNKSSGRVSVSSNAHASRIGSQDSNTLGTQTPQDSELLSGRKRSHHSSSRGSGTNYTDEGASVKCNLSKLSKRRHLSPNVPGPSSTRADPSDADVNSSESLLSSDSEHKNMSAVTDDDFVKRTDKTKLDNKYIWRISKHLKNSKWTALGRSLGVEESELIGIKHNYNHCFRECAYQMLLAWKQRFPRKCTYGKLYCGLQKEGLFEAARAMSVIDVNSHSD